MIHLIVGNTGSGKTTYSNSLKKESGGLIFSIDQWNNTLFIPDKEATDGLEWFLERIERVESLMMELVKQLESSGIDSILDLGLSKFEHREKFRRFAAEHHFQIRLHYLDIAKKTRYERVRQRNLQKGDTFEFEVSDENFEFMEGWFETPRESELEDALIIEQ
ncbi:AAA family ATPase [Lutimonas sp.]|uniref:AAA family ATPase n=1 Tax=Lutimonas sp. TaxID=1872403 RepID=UPI003D9ADBB9